MKQQNFDEQRCATEETDVNSNGPLNPLFQDVIPGCVFRFGQPTHAQQNTQHNADSYADKGHADGKERAFEEKLVVLSNHTEVKVHQCFELSERSKEEPPEEGAQCWTRSRLKA